MANKVTDETEVRQSDILREWCFLNYLRSSFNTLETLYQGYRKLELSLVTLVLLIEIFVSLKKYYFVRRHYILISL